MLSEVQFYYPRPLSADGSMLTGLRLSSEQGRLLGLRNDQTVRGVLDSGSNSMVINTDYGSHRFAMTGAGSPHANLLFKVWVTANGVVLQPLRQSLIKQEKPATGQAPPGPPLSSWFPDRLSYLYQQKTPLSGLAALVNPQVLKQMLSSARTPQPELDEAMDRLWQSRNNLSAATIKTALLSSGLVNVGAAAVAGLTLKKFLEQLKKLSVDNLQSSAELKASDLTDAVDYIESAQLHALAKQEAGEILYRFPILLFDAAPAEVTIYRERNPDNREAESSWQIDVDIPLGLERDLQVSIQLLESATVNVVAWTSSKSLLTMMKSELGSLGSRFAAWDILLGSFQVVYGQRPIWRDLAVPENLPSVGRLDCYT